ncbi:hypothetical protein HMPREF0083_03370 [Aneurinibacillus aneurinilyticus ATCC 12856]|uniref:Uncharacterized protein n=1 Tax=Aneurinibacillus aneurinilyticus ATCC 12856 TaxID=649747 RepID=U1X0L7_ANEAE|nr:hypothetical protein HMPREF0083_03370 [Aneurinibacillus aneurinilyticus ATCC 12856]
MIYIYEPITMHASSHSDTGRTEHATQAKKGEVRLLRTPLRYPISYPPI